VCEWPDSLDALAAASAFHRLVLENDDVRVLETRIGPGETAPLHTHRRPSVLYVLAPGHVVRRDHEGTLLTDSRASGAPSEAGTAAWIAPMPPHTVENVGSEEIRLLNVEMKRG
jgi:mannose-6-phosphate isomerase-like protein (cupin superfamily)